MWQIAYGQMKSSGSGLAMLPRRKPDFGLGVIGLRLECPRY